MDGSVGRCCIGGWQDRQALARHAEGQAWAVMLSGHTRVVLPPRSAFVGFRFASEVVVIVVAVRWYLRFNLIATAPSRTPDSSCTLTKDTCATAAIRALTSQRGATDAPLT
jgi:hypothetical protein